MSGNLSSADLERILNLYNTQGATGGGEGGSYVAPTAVNDNGREYFRQYTPAGQSGGGESSVDQGGNTPSGYMGYNYDPATMQGHESLLNGTNYDMYDNKGAVTGQGTFQGLTDHSVLQQDVLPFMMAAIPMALTAAGVAGAAGVVAG